MQNKCLGAKYNKGKLVFGDFLLFQGLDSLVWWGLENKGQYFGSVTPLQVYSRHQEE